MSSDHGSVWVICHERNAVEAPWDPSSADYNKRSADQIEAVVTHFEAVAQRLARERDACRLLGPRHKTLRLAAPARSKLHLHLDAQLALHDVRCGAAAYDDVVETERRLAGVLRVVFLVERRSGEDAHHARMAQVADYAADVVLAAARREIQRPRQRCRPCPGAQTPPRACAVKMCVETKDTS